MGMMGERVVAEEGEGVGRKGASVGRVDGNGRHEVPPWRSVPVTQFKVM